MIRKEDNLWKGLLEDLFPDFIRFIHPGAEEFLDLERGYEFQDKELEQVFPPENEEFAPKVVDKLVKVFLKNGEEEFILIHLEVQGKYSDDFGKRMFVYFYRLFDKYNKNISAYAIFTEATPKERPNFFEREFMKTKVIYYFNIFKITDFTDEELMANENPFAMVVLAARAVIAGKKIRKIVERDLFLMELKYNLVKQLLNRKIAVEKAKSILIFIKYYIRFDIKETNIIFERKIGDLSDKTNTMGIEEQILDLVEKRGIIKGKIEGKLEGKIEGKLEGKVEGKLEGIKEGSDKLKRQFVRNLRLNLGFTDKQTAEMLEVTVKYVKEVCKTELIQ